MEDLGEANARNRRSRRAIAGALCLLGMVMLRPAALQADEGQLMRGLWENEKSMSPALLRSALGLAGAFLALSSAVMLVIAVASVTNGKYPAAAMQLAAGIAVPFGIWLALRMLADMLITLHRAHDRLDAIERLAGGPLPAEAEPALTQNAAGSRTGDAGPT